MFGCSDNVQVLFQFHKGPSKFQCWQSRPKKIEKFQSVLRANCAQNSGFTSQKNFFHHYKNKLTTNYYYWAKFENLIYCR